ncbi:GNAT family N-acetyltransferase [Chryseomicrobium aureum]|uniref:GNAT family N-acetyltransferase n=1 Tax=Chryseomicrobium aureum TaxID=1441723 RepID=UPI00370D3312
MKSEKYTYTPLEWDTTHFGVMCSKLVLHAEISVEKLTDLIGQNMNVQFITIVNEQSNPINSRVIGEFTNAFLADINIQFQKNILEQQISEGINITSSYPYNQKIVDLASFQVSRFIEDQKLNELGGKDVYREWLKNSFNRDDKFYATSVDSNGEINGFVLFSFASEKCIIELIAVDVNSAIKGIGSKLFKTVEAYANDRDIKVLQVGTQIRNLTAINFYHKMGCKQVGCHQVYHLWN